MISHASWSGAGVSWVQGTAAKTSALGEGYRETSKVRIPTEADWILKVMVAMAAADGRLDAREVGLIQKVYKDWLGRSVDVSGVVLAAQAYATKRDVLIELSLAAGSMSRETKEEIIRAAYLTLLADKRIATEERKKLKNVAIALQIPEDQFDAILRAIEHTLGGEPFVTHICVKKSTSVTHPLYTTGGERKSRALTATSGLLSAPCTWSFAICFRCWQLSSRTCATYASRR